MPSQHTPPRTVFQQRCSALCARLGRVKGFQTYFDMIQTQDNTGGGWDPVHQLREVLLLGTSLCYLWDLLPKGYPETELSHFDKATDEANTDEEKRAAIIRFAMQVNKRDVRARTPGLLPLSVNDLWDRSSDDGLIKVCRENCFAYRNRRLLTRFGS